MNKVAKEKDILAKNGLFRYRFSVEFFLEKFENINRKLQKRSLLILVRVNI